MNSTSAHGSQFKNGLSIGQGGKTKNILILVQDRERSSLAKV